MTVNPRLNPTSQSGSSAMSDPQNDEAKAEIIEPVEEPEEQPVASDLPTTEQSINEVEKLLHDLQIENDEDYTVTKSDFDENGDPVFPHDLLAKLDEMVNKPKWIIPVLPKAELELLMNASIKLAKKGSLFYP